MRARWPRSSATVRAKRASRRAASANGPRVVAGQPRHRERQQVEVQRVAVVVERSLDVAAVGADLARHLLDQDAAAERRPRRRAAQLGQRAAGDVEGERFAEQVRVGAEVGRQVLLDERAAGDRGRAADRRATGARRSRRGRRGRRCRPARRRTRAPRSTTATAAPAPACWPS